MSQPIFGYWDIRGLAEPVRYLLHYQGVEFEDKRYVYEHSDEWFEKDKLNLGLDFPNLPYLIDGDVKLTQSTTILRYLARKYNLAGRSEKEKIRVELTEQQVVDLRTNLIRLSYSPEFESLKGEFIRNVPAQLQLFSKFLGNREYFAGDDITYVDFMAYDTFDLYLFLVPHALEEFKNLEDFQERIDNIPNIQKYLKSSTFRRWPVFSPKAYFGGKGEEPKIPKRK